MKKKEFKILELNEGQEFTVDGRRFIVKNGVPQIFTIKGPLGGDIVEAQSCGLGQDVLIRGKVSMVDQYGKIYIDLENYNPADTRMFESILNPLALVEINIPAHIQTASGEIFNQ